MELTGSSTRRSRRGKVATVPLDSLKSLKQLHTEDHSFEAWTYPPTYYSKVAYILSYGPTCQYM